MKGKSISTFSNPVPKLSPTLKPASSINPLSALPAWTCLSYFVFKGWGTCCKPRGLKYTQHQPTDRDSRAHRTQETSSLLWSNTGPPVAPRILSREPKPLLLPSAVTQSKPVPQSPSKSPGFAPGLSHPDEKNKARVLTFLGFHTTAKK